MMRITLCLCLLGTVLSQAQQPRVTGKDGFISKIDTFSHKDDVSSAKEKLDFLELNKDVDDIIEGDIMPSKKTSRNALLDETRYWPSTRIPVAYSILLPLEAVAGIDEARTEYQLRTCLDFADRTNEQDYLFFQPLNGCYSNVGIEGGQQTISIGDGCERHSTIQHEMLHAIGIYHEQSRPDRDDYINIETQNIDASKLNNFNKYDYTYVDDRRVPYDYNSIMHYSDSGFSINGQPTITTKDPAFQDVIGQRRTFSPGDVDMINRMYPCADPLKYSYSCGFEVQNACGYVQDEDDDIDWYLTHLDLTDPDALGYNPTSLQTDNSYGEVGRGSVMRMRTEDGLGVANMASMRLQTTTTQQCLQFSYYMELNDNSENAELSVRVGTIDQTTGDILSTTPGPLVTITGNHGKYWVLERFTMQAPAEKYKLVFSARNGHTDDIIALDDIQIQDRPCDTAYLQIHDYSQVLAATADKSGFWTDPLYTEDGYSFRLKIYPSGHPSGAEGYMGLFFGLSAGENDDELQWPFDNRVVRLQVEDQDPDVLMRMSQYSQLFTSPGNDAWDQPEPDVYSGYGYRSFMKISDITSTRSFWKNDAVVFSVNIRDMNQVAQAQREQRAIYEDEKARGLNPEPFFRMNHDEDRVGVDIDLDVSDKVHVSIDVSVGDENTSDDDNQQKDQRMVTYGTAIGITLACCLTVFIMMSAVLMCISSTHKKSIHAIVTLMARNAVMKDEKDDRIDL